MRGSVGVFLAAREANAPQGARSRCCGAPLRDEMTRAESPVPGQMRYRCEACGRVEPPRQSARAHVEGDGMPYFERPVRGQIARGTVYRTRCAYCGDPFAVHYRRGKFPQYCTEKPCAKAAARARRRRGATAA